MEMYQEDVLELSISSLLLLYFSFLSITQTLMEEQCCSAEVAHLNETSLCAASGNRRECTCVIFTELQATSSWHKLLTAFISRCPLPHSTNSFC